MPNKFIKPIELRPTSLSNPHQTKSKKYQKPPQINVYIAVSKSSNSGGTSGTKDQKRETIKKSIASIYSKNLEIRQYFASKFVEFGETEYLNMLVTLNKSKLIGYIKFDGTIDLSKVENKFYKQKYQQWLVYEEDRSLKYKYAWIINETITVQDKDMIKLPGQVGLMQIAKTDQLLHEQINTIFKKQFKRKQEEKDWVWFIVFCIFAFAIIYYDLKQ